MSGRFLSDIDEAVKSGDVVTVKEYLKKYPTRVNDPLYQDSRRPVHIAALYDQLQMLEVLVSYGADITVTDQGGHTPLHLAAKAGSSRVVIYLLDCKANTESITRGNKWTALHFAAEAGKCSVVEDLVKAGANTKAETKDGITPLHLACQKGHTEVVAALILSGADAAAKDRVGFTPLHMAVESHTAPLVQLLLWYHAEVNAQSRFGWTPLHIAAQLGDVPCIKLLLGAGANLGAETNQGKTAHDIAVLNGQSEVLPLLVPVSLPPIEKRGSSARDPAFSTPEISVAESAGSEGLDAEYSQNSAPGNNTEWQQQPPPQSPPAAVAVVSPFQREAIKPMFSDLSISADTRDQAIASGPCCFCVDGPSRTPGLFICPITERVMEDPVVAVDGYTYERRAITDWFKKGNALSPATGQVFKHSTVIPNVPLKKAILEWQDWCAQTRAGSNHADRVPGRGPVCTI